MARDYRKVVARIIPNAADGHAEPFYRSIVLKTREKLEKVSFDEFARAFGGDNARWEWGRQVDAWSALGQLGPQVRRVGRKNVLPKIWEITINLGSESVTPGIT